MSNAEPAPVEKKKSVIDTWDKVIRLVVFVAVSLWAAGATILANLPLGSYTVAGEKTIAMAPDSTGQLTARCKETDTAQVWKVSTDQPVASAIYVASDVNPIMEDGKRVGFLLSIWNGAGRGRPTANVGMELTCQYEHNVVSRFLRNFVR